MKNRDKINQINQLLLDIKSLNLSIANDGHESYFNYDSVISDLEEIIDKIDRTLRYPRPHNLPKHIKWSEIHYDSKNEYDPCIVSSNITLEEITEGENSVEE